MLVKASIVVRPDPDELIRVPYEIHGKMCQLTNDEIQTHLDKEENIKKAAEEAKLLAMSKPKLIKVVHEEASNVEIDPKVLTFEFPVSKPESKIIRSSYGPVIDSTLPEQPKSPPVAPKANKGKGIATDDIESPKMLVKASIVVRPDPDELIRVPYEIHGKMCQLTNDEIQAH
ncbi:hypothetical protein Tco_0849342, partial [Tanacetum coccineum]